VFPGPALILEQKIDEVAGINGKPRFRKLFRLIFSSDLQVDGGYVGKCFTFRPEIVLPVVFEEHIVRIERHNQVGRKTSTLSKRIPTSFKAV